MLADRRRGLREHPRGHDRALPRRRLHRPPRAGLLPGRGHARQLRRPDRVHRRAIAPAPGSQRRRARRPVDLRRPRRRGDRAPPSRGRAARPRGRDRGLARADRRGGRRGAPAHRAQPPRRRPAAPRRARPHAGVGRAPAGRRARQRGRAARPGARAGGAGRRRAARARARPAPGRAGRARPRPRAGVAGHALAAAAAPRRPARAPAARSGRDDRLLHGLRGADQRAQARRRDRGPRRGAPAGPEAARRRPR